MRYYLTYRLKVRNMVRYCSDSMPFEKWLPPMGPERVFALVEGLTDPQFKLLCDSLKQLFDAKHAVLSWRGEEDLQQRDAATLINFRQQWSALNAAVETSTAKGRTNQDLMFLKLFLDTQSEVLKLGVPLPTSRPSSPFLDAMNAKMKKGTFSLLEFERDRSRGPNGERVPPRTDLEPHEIEGSALYWLHGWGVRMQKHHDDDRPSTKCDWMVFRPDEHARKALSQLSLKYPLIVRGILDYLDHTNKAFEVFLKRPTERTRDALAQSEGELTRRVTTDVKIIIDQEKLESRSSVNASSPVTARKNQKPSEVPGEGIVESQGLNDTAEHRWTEATANERAMQLSKKDPLFVMKTLRQWATEIGCSTGLVAKTAFWKATIRKREQSGPTKQIRAKTVSPDKLDMLTVLVKEQDADSENDERMQRTAKRNVRRNS